MTAPADPAVWLPMTVVRAHLGTTAGSEQDTHADTARLAAASYVEQHRPDLFVEDLDGLVSYDPPGSVVYGALLLTARLYARRSTPQGVASFGEFGPGAILRLDPDVQRMLGLGRNATPRVG